MVHTQEQSSGTGDYSCLFERRSYRRHDQPCMPLDPLQQNAHEQELMQVESRNFRGRKWLCMLKTTATKGIIQHHLLLQSQNQENSGAENDCASWKQRLQKASYSITCCCSLRTWHSVSLTVIAPGLTAMSQSCLKRTRRMEHEATGVGLGTTKDFLGAMQSLLDLAPEETGQKVKQVNVYFSSSSSSSRDNMNTWPLSLRPSPHSIGIYTYFKGLQCMHIMIFLIKVIYQSS